MDWSTTVLIIFLTLVVFVLGLLAVVNRLVKKLVSFVFRPLTRARASRS